MNIAIIKDGTCIDASVFDDLETAESFLAGNVWEGASEVLLLPDGYGIGDFYANGTWEKAPNPEPAPPLPSPPPHDPLADLDALTLDHELRLIFLELGV